MNKIPGYLKEYFFSIDKRILILSTLFIALLIFINYHFRLEKAIIRLPFFLKYVSWFTVFFISFTFPYLLSVFFKKKILVSAQLLALVFLAPALFAWKLSANVHFSLSSDQELNKFWNHIVYWPFKLVVVGVCIWVIWKLLENDQNFYGFSTNNFQLKPYLTMLLIMVPLVAAAATQKDFLAMYPKLSNVQFFLEENNSWVYKLLYELSYGSDFVSIELFFRGFLILAFVKWAGKETILPMAVFYCTIHFGKPLGECISSFLGGIILGVITYRTKTILGGLIVHLGIAWLMELAGFIGNTAST